MILTNLEMDKSSTSKKDSNKTNSKMKKLFGFTVDDFRSWSDFVRLMNRPEDPASLGVFRILFGLVMMLDIPNERGLA